MQLYKMLLSRGYPESFCDLVTKNLNTDFTASRMIGYLCHYSDLPPEEEVGLDPYSIDPTLDAHLNPRPSADADLDDERNRELGDLRHVRRQLDRKSVV